MHENVEILILFFSEKMVFDATGDVSKFIEVHNSKGMILNQSFLPSQFSSFVQYFVV
jgi:hypothetical protein